MAGNLENKHKHALSFRGSYEYRNNFQLIRQGEVTDKYTRILPFIPGNAILEMGAAEGVLALLLAERKKRVIALETNPERHNEALKLQQLWREKGFKVDSCEMVLGDMQNHYDKLRLVDTFVAVRAIYYLGENLESVFAKIAGSVQNVVLCGNQSRSRQYFAERGRTSTDPLGHFNYYASLDGMWSLLTRLGFTITHAVPDGDPIVVGRRL